MNTERIKTLAIVLLVLIVGVVALTYSNRLGNGSAGDLLLPDLKSQINDIVRVTVTKAEDTVTIRNDSGTWVLAERQDYPVDTGTLRTLLLTLADARKLEQKTSNPEMYGRLGIEDTSADSQGTEIRIAGSDSEQALILGNLAQRSYRYARIVGEDKSWLIDQNPTLPNSVSAWVLQDILDIDQSRIQSVMITHNDGDAIQIDKGNPADKDYKVANIPDGRELSYASIVDPIAGVLGGLSLQDVAKDLEAEKNDSTVTTVFNTFDGLEITVDSFLREEDFWVVFQAGGTDEASDEADEINSRLNGWTFHIQSYKANQLRRRWDDILKAEE